MANPEHVKWLKEGVEAWNQRRVEEPFDPDLSGADLTDKDLSAADLHRANLMGARLKRAGLVLAVLREANLVGADLSEAEVSAADLSGAELVGANLSGADLRDAKLVATNLYWARLAWAKLSGADFSHADVRTRKTGATDDPFELSVTKLTFATTLTQEQLNSMIGTRPTEGLTPDHATLIPDWLDYPDDWERIIDQYPEDFPDFHETEGSPLVDPTTASIKLPDSDDNAKIILVDNRLDLEVSYPDEEEAADPLKNTLLKRAREDAANLRRAAGNRFLRLNKLALKIEDQLRADLAEIDLVDLHLNLEQIRREKDKPDAKREDGNLDEAAVMLSTTCCFLALRLRSTIPLSRKSRSGYAAIAWKN